MGYKNTIKSIAIGSFDGMHVAHQRLIDKVEAVVIVERNGGYLTPGHKRSYFTSKVCCFYHFDVIKGLSPEEFVQKLQVDFPHLELIVVGYDFHFGKNKAGNAEILKRLFGKEVLIVKEVCKNGIAVHSRIIKAYLKEGNLKMATQLLGRDYEIEGEVIAGQGLGAKQLVPTLNLKITQYQLPKEGVYVTQTKIANKWLGSVSFLGHRVSTDGSFAVETHILDEALGTVEGSVSIQFVARLRDNEKFENLEALKMQIEEDISKAKNILSKKTLSKKTFL